jgi:4-carboxymuconolactone decarboxylase
MANDSAYPSGLPSPEHYLQQAFIKASESCLTRRIAMSDRKIPSKHYQELFRLFPEAMAALENLGSTIRRSGPIDEKTIHLIQLAGAAAVQSEGSVHSHTRSRALEVGVTREEIYHALLLLVSTIGFPKVTAAFSWSKDILDKQDKK